MTTRRGLSERDNAAGDAAELAKVIGYGDESGTYCPDCAVDKVGPTLDGRDATDDDGKLVRAVRASEAERHPKGLYCVDCNETLIEPIWTDPGLYSIRLSNSGDDPTHIIAVVEGEYADQWADHHGSLDGGTWERADGPTFVYDILYWRPGLFETLEDEGYRFDYSEFGEPDEHDLAVAKHASECDECSYDWHKAETHMRAKGAKPA